MSRPSESLVCQARSKHDTAQVSMRNLITIGVFAAIYAVVTSVGWVIGVFNPVSLIASYAVSSMLSGTVVMLMLAKAPVFGAMTMLGIIGGGLAFTMGSYVMSVPICVVLGFCADVIVYSGHFRSRACNIIAYGVFSIWTVVPFAPIFLGAQRYFESVTQRRRSDDHVQTMMTIFNHRSLFAIAILIAILAMIGARVGTTLVDRHFAKAGMIH